MIHLVINPTLVGQRAETAMFMQIFGALLHSEFAQRIANSAPQFCEAFVRFNNSDPSFIVTVADCIPALFEIHPPEATTSLFIRVSRAVAFFADVADFGNAVFYIVECVKRVSVHSCRPEIRDKAVVAFVKLVQQAANCISRIAKTLTTDSTSGSLDIRMAKQHCRSST
jgi:hypothetical protein